MVGYGGVIRDENGYIEFIFHCNLGKAIKNMVELMALQQCLKFLRDANLHNVIIEVDYELIINSVKKICYGSALERVSKHWRLLPVYQRIQSHMQNMRTLCFKHVRMKANKLVDILANDRALCAKSRNIYRCIEVPQVRLRDECLRQENVDREPYQNMRL